MNRPSAVTALLTKRYNLNQTLKRGAESVADYILALEDELSHLSRQNQALVKRSEEVERLASFIETVHGDEAYFEAYVEETLMEMEYRGPAKMHVTFHIPPSDDLFKNAPIVQGRYIMRLSKMEKRKRDEAKG